MRGGLGSCLQAAASLFCRFVLCRARVYLPASATIPSSFYRMEQKIKVSSFNCSVPPGAKVQATSSTGGSRVLNGKVVSFELSPSRFLKLQKGDITAWSVDGTTDAIVNAANGRMLGGGGVDGAIHRAAGPELKEACYKVPEAQPGVRCPTGEARITPGFRLPVAHVIHTVGPVYDMDDRPSVSLRNSYRNSLTLAKENGIQYVAFPALSCGIFGYPYEEASKIAISTIKEFKNDFKEVHFVLFADDIYNVWLRTANELL